MNTRTSSFFLSGVCLIVVLGLAAAGIFQNNAPTPPTAPRIFDVDQSVIPIGGCITLSWIVPDAAHVVLRGSNWPEGVQEGVTSSGISTVCPDTATHYVPDQPVRYTLLASYSDGHTDTHEVVVNYDMSSTISPTATPSPVVSAVGYTGYAATPDAAINASFQAFENGWMLWRSDTDTVFALMGDSSMFAYTFDLSALAPANLYPPTPSPDLLHPQVSFPFDRVWQRDPSIRERIGWATTAALAYTARVMGQTAPGFGISLPDGRSAALNFTGIWYLEGITQGNWTLYGAPALFSSSSYPTLTPAPTSTPTQIWAIYQPFEHGFMVSDQTGHCVYSMTYAEANSPARIIMAHVEGTPSLADSYHYCEEVSNLPDYIADRPPPAGLLLPTGALGKAWGHYAYLRDLLGYASSPAQYYVSSIPPQESTLGGGPFSIPQIALPDGRALWCGFRSATQGLCYLQ
jgi:hypothetical protein